MADRADFITDEHLDYLDELRDSGKTNMFGAGSYVQQAYPELNRSETRQVLAYWMRTFAERHGIVDL